MLRLLAVSLLSLSMFGFHDSHEKLDKRSVQLTDIHADLSPFEDLDRYDYVEDDFEYFVIDKEQYDDIFYQSAVLAAQLHQVREVGGRYKDGQLELGNAEDFDFLALTVADALASLPNMMTEAQSLSDQLSGLNPRSDFGRSPFAAIEAVRGLRQTGRNLKQVLDAGSEVDEVLDDFEALQADIETVESAGEPTQG